MRGAAFIKMRAACHVLGWGHLSKAPSLASATKARHCSAPNASTGPVGSLESRTYTASGRPSATSTQLPPPLPLLLVDLRHRRSMLAPLAVGLGVSSQAVERPTIRGDPVRILDHQVVLDAVHEHDRRMLGEREDGEAAGKSRVPPVAVVDQYLHLLFGIGKRGQLLLRQPVWADLATHSLRAKEHLYAGAVAA